VGEPTRGLRYGELACNDGIKVEAALTEKGSALGLHRILFIRLIGSLPEEPHIVTDFPSKFTCL
jgi:hypothetical protein